MANGRLGSVDLSAATWTNCYQVGVGKTAAVMVNICNRNNTAITIRLATTVATGTPNNTEFIEYETSIPAYGVLEKGGIVLDSTKYIMAYSSSANVSVNVYGYEE